MYKTFHGNEDARGIGLCITKNQLEAMKGKIEVESEEGIGSAFKIYINEKKNCNIPLNLPDVILLDLNMPILDGWQFLDEFILLPICKEICIFIVSSS